MNIKLAVCALIGHSRIITACFGYQHCGRCREQVGDTLSGIGVGTTVGIGHNCEGCYENYKKMTWRDKFLVKNPITGPMETQADRLEAVEKVLMTVCHCPNDEHTAECPENIAYIAWCEAAGKDE